MLTEYLWHVSVDLVGSLLTTEGRQRANYVLHDEIGGDNSEEYIKYLMCWMVKRRMEIFLETVENS